MREQLTTWLSKWAPKFAPWVLLVAVVWLCWVCAALIWLFIAPPKAPQLAQIALNQSAVDGSSNGDNFSVFAQPKPMQQTQQAPSDMSLQGVLLATPADYSSAVIAVAGDVRTYRIGKEVAQTGYTLTKVSWNEAVLTDNSGNEVTLSLLQDDILNQHQHTGNNTNMGAQSSVSNTYQYEQPNESSSSPQSQREQMYQMFDTAVNELRTNPASYLSRMGVMATGDGYQVTEAMNAGVRNDIGLQPGDKVISVNGQAVGQPQQDAALLEQIRQTGQAEIQVQRGSQVITVRQEF